MDALTLDTPLTRAALAIAQRVHAKQFRHDGITPYISHPIAVANRAYDLFTCHLTGAKTGLARISEDQWRASFMRDAELLVAVAANHDACEDHPDVKEWCIVGELRGLGLIDLKEAALVRDGLTRLNRLNHSSSYLSAVIAARGLWVSALVKWADLWHNLQGDIPQSRREKYMLAQYILESV